jgi:hypothetical protein
MSVCSETSKIRENGFVCAVHCGRSKGIARGGPQASILRSFELDLKSTFFHRLAAVFSSLFLDCIPTFFTKTRSATGHVVRVLKLRFVIDMFVSASRILKTSCGPSYIVCGVRSRRTPNSLEHDHDPVL